MSNTIGDLLPEAKANVPLAPYTSFHIGGPAAYFFTAFTKEDIQKAVKAAKQADVPFFVLSGGTNLLVSDEGFLGLVIHIESTGIRVVGTKLHASAGTLFSDIVAASGEQGLAGLEWAGGLPGTVGGAVRGNAGAFGGEVKDTAVRVEALDREGDMHIYSNNECEFSYRSSIFKKNNLIVLSTVFQLKEGRKEEIQAIAEDHIRYREERHPLEYPNSGSIFKNCDLRNFSEELQEQLKDVVKVDPFKVVPTAYLISEAGLKGERVGDAEVSRKHPNYIVNRGEAAASDVLSLVEKVKAAVQQKFSVNLEVEVQYLE